MKPLEGYTVVDLTTVVAASVCGRLLSDLGARVIKIEPPKGDSWRASGVGFAANRFSPEENPIFDIYNSGKDMICVNLKTEEGMQIIHRLLEKADIFVTNNRPAALKRLGLSYDDLKERYPKLVYGILLGFGEKGPDAQKPTYDVTAFWARSGFLRDTAVQMEGYQPVDAPSGVGDSCTGTNLTMQILAAMMAREKTGKGQCVRASLYHIGAFAMASMTVMSQRPFGRQRPMTRPDSQATSGAFQCADGEWLYLIAGFDLVCRLGGRPELMQDPRFELKNRWQNRELVYETLKEIILKKTADEWLELLAEYDTPTVRMAHFADVSEDEQAWANGYVERVEYPNGNVNVVPTCPVDMDCMERPKTQPTKSVGQDTARVLEEFGYSSEQIGRWKENGVVRG